MYREHFGLQLKPFSITPDPKFLYMSPQHKEALAHLLYGLKEGTGFVVITGEVGTGKTTILNAFLLRLPPRMPKVVIKNPHIKPENLYYLLGEAISLPEEKRSRDHLAAFEDRLKATGGAVLICDEAQGLSYEMLEEIRLLSNLETVHEKLVQIMLLGQQELNDKLNSPQLRQLKQRIGVKYHIPPLDANETRDYIDHRLRVAGYEPKEEPLFTPSAVGEIYRYTRGFPRLINIVCDNVLLAAYSEDMNQVSASLVKKVVANMEKTYVRHSSPVPARHIRRVGLGLRKTGVVAALAALAAIAVAATLVRFSPVGKDMIDKAVTLYKTLREPSRIEQGTTQLHGASPGERAGGDGTGSLRDTATLGGHPSGGGTGTSVMESPPGELDAVREQGTAGVTQDRGPARVTVGPGDTLAKIALRHYGRVDSAILRSVTEANPEIKDINIVYEGQSINLPPLKNRAAGLYTVSVAAFTNIDEATPILLDLVKKGYNATILSSRDERGATWYRVTIGAFSSQARAQEYASGLRTKGFPFARVMILGMEG